MAAGGGGVRRGAEQLRIGTTDYREPAVINFVINFLPEGVVSYERDVSVEHHHTRVRRALHLRFTRRRHCRRHPRTFE